MMKATTLLSGGAELWRTVGGRGREGVKHILRAWKGDWHPLEKHQVWDKGVSERG